MQGTKDGASVTTFCKKARKQQWRGSCGRCRSGPSVNENTNKRRRPLYTHCNVRQEEWIVCLREILLVLIITCAYIFQ